MLRGYITNLGAYNAGALIGEWIDFPISDEELKKVLLRIGVYENDDEMKMLSQMFYDEYISEEFFITDYDYDDPMPFSIAKFFGEYSSINSINEFAEYVDGLSDDDMDLLTAYFEAFNEPSDVDDFIDICENVHRFYLIDVDDNDELGRYFVDNGLFGDDIPSCYECYLDYSAIGNDISYSGSFTSKGFLMEC